MRGLLKMCFALLLTLSVFAADHAMAGQVVSTMRNVNAVMQARGFYLAPAQNTYAAYSPTGVDLAPVQAFEIIRPRGEKVTIGRLYTSCSCVQLETTKRTFNQGERAVLNLHNVVPTPAQGQNYAIYVQITSPIRTTLRFDTFVQSSQFVSQAPVIIQDLEPEIVEDMAEKTEESQDAADPDTAESSVRDAADEAVEAATEAIAEAKEAVTEAITEAAEAVEEATETLKVKEVDLPEATEEKTETDTAE